MKALFTWIFLLPLAVFSQSFELTGSVGDTQKQPLPFASVMIKGTTSAGEVFQTGTNTNKMGRFSLRAPAGNYKLTFQYIGFSKSVKEVNLQADQNFQILLQPEKLEMKGVSISSKEDPAYPIVRQAIQKREYYQTQLNAFSSKVYIKGLQRLRSTPDNLSKILKLSVNGAMADSNLLGVLYLSESETEYHFKQPDYQKEVMYSSKVSGNNQAFSYNQASDIIVDFYKNQLDLGNLSDRPFISPIANNALFYYKYELLGTFVEEGATIYKIKVKPKRKLDPCFSGTMYLQDGSFRIYAMDVLLGKEAKIDFVDSLAIKQTFTPVNDTLWMPSSLNFSFVFSAFGFKGDGYFNSVFNQYQPNREYPRKFFKGEVLKVEDGANKKDSTYWETNRPIPLTQEEMDDYRKKDSLERIRSSKPYQDSIDKISNKFTWKKALLGYQWRDRKSNLSVKFDGIPQSIQYNTVQGVSLGFQSEVRKEYSKNRELEGALTTRYGFSNHLWTVKGSVNYLRNQPTDERWSGSIGREIRQINGTAPISPLVNSLYTVLAGRNYAKFLLADGVGVGYNREWVNGLYSNLSASYTRYQPLENTTTWNLSKDPWITSNNPFELFNLPQWSSFSAFTLGIEGRVVIGQKYYSRPNEKVRLSSKYPSLRYKFQWAVPVAGASADYQFAQVRLRDTWNLRLFGSGTWIVEGGTFLRSKNLPLPLFRHFEGNQTLLSSGDPDSWRLLPYYTFSTGGTYWAAHYEHYFQRFLFNKIPLMRKTSWREVAGIHYLQTSDRGNFMELNLGISGLGKLGRADFVLARNNQGNWMKGLTLGFRLGG